MNDQLCTLGRCGARRGGGAGNASAARTSTTINARGGARGSRGGRGGKCQQLGVFIRLGKEMNCGLQIIYRDNFIVFPFALQSDSSIKKFFTSTLLPFDDYS